MQLNEWIKANTTQRNVAAKLGITTTRLSRICSGEYEPTLEEVWQIEHLTKNKVKMEDFVERARKGISEMLNALGQPTA